MEAIKDDFVFQIDASIVREAYKKDNFLIEFDKECVDKTTCAVYFSSNDIYFPNTEDAFKSRIFEKDFYEMYNTRVKSAYKHIFIRDIYKQWYIYGINSRIHSPELLLKFLEDETMGCSVITIGSSAGGYAAVLYGSLLSANRVFSFNGQFELCTLLETSNPQTDPLLFRNAKSAVSKYYDLKSFINQKIDIYYFTSLGSAWDNQQYHHVKDITTLKPILFKTSHHGVPFVKSALPVVINTEGDILNKWVNKKFNPIAFSVRIAGLNNTLITLYKQLKNKLR